MINNLILGRYIPINSFIHNLDPRTKLITIFYYISIIFLANNFETYLLLSFFSIFFILLSKVNIIFFLRGIKPVVWLIIFMVIAQLLFTNSGDIYWRFHILKITNVGIINASFIFFRLTLIVLMSTLLTLTTSPLQLTDAIEYFLKPISSTKLPIKEISLMLSIALRFIPILIDETEKIMNAQRSRGFDFSEGTLIRRLKSIVTLLIPLVVSSFNRAEYLAISMEARGYIGSSNRSKYRILHWDLKDTLVIVFLFFLSLSLLYLRK